MKRAISSSRFKFVEYEFKSSRRYTDSRKGTDMHYLAYMEEGRCKFFTDTQVLDIQQGEAFYIPLGLSYESYWYGNGTIRFRSYGFTVFPEAQEQSFLMQKLPDVGDNLEKILRIPTMGKPDSKALLLLYDAVSTLLPHLQQGSLSKGRLITETAKNYLNAHPFCTTEKLAEHCCVSQSALYASFQKELGTTPNEVRQLLLCRKAAELLTTTDKSVQEISDSLNFSSTSYFRKILRKHTGKTPRQIRSEASPV